MIKMISNKIRKIADEIAVTVNKNIEFQPSTGGPGQPKMDEPDFEKVKKT